MCKKLCMRICKTRDPWALIVTRVYIQFPAKNENNCRYMYLQKIFISFEDVSNIYKIHFQTMIQMNLIILEYISRGINAPHPHHLFCLLNIQE